MGHGLLVIGHWSTCYTLSQLRYIAFLICIDYTPHPIPHSAEMCSIQVGMLYFTRLKIAIAVNLKKPANDSAQDVLRAYPAESATIGAC